MGYAHWYRLLPYLGEENGKSHLKWEGWLICTKNLHTHIYKPNVIFSIFFKPKKQEHRS